MTGIRLTSREILLLYTMQTSPGLVMPWAQYPFLPVAGWLLAIAALTGCSTDLLGAVASLICFIGALSFIFSMYWQQTQAKGRWAIVYGVCHIVASSISIIVLCLHDGHCVSYFTRFNFNSLTGNQLLILAFLVEGLSNPAAQAVKAYDRRRQAPNSCALKPATVSTTSIAV